MNIIVFITRTVTGEVKANDQMNMVTWTICKI